MKNKNKNKWYKLNRFRISLFERQRRFKNFRNSRIQLNKSIRDLIDAYNNKGQVDSNVRDLIEDLYIKKKIYDTLKIKRDLSNIDYNNITNKKYLSPLHPFYYKKLRREVEKQR